MRLYNDVIQESHLVYGDHTEHLNVNNFVIHAYPGMSAAVSILSYTPFCHRNGNVKIIIYNFKKYVNS